MLATNQYSPLGRKVIPQVCLLVIMLAVLVNQTHAQSSYPTDGSTPMGLRPGSPAGSYALSGFDNVNLFNGSLNFRLPLISIGGRGGAAHTIMLPIEKKWQVETYTIQGDDYTETHHYPNGDWWEVTGPGYGPGVMHVRYGEHLTRNCNTDGMKRAWYSLTRLTFTASDGTEFELRDKVSGGAKYTVPICASSGFNRGKVFVTADGTSATFISDSDIVDLYLSDGSGGDANQIVSGYLMLSDGTRYRIDAGYVTWIRDRNGNKVNFSYTSGQVTTITDSLNRQITVAYNVQDVSPYGLCDKITFKGFGGATRVIRVSTPPGGIHFDMQLIAKGRPTTTVTQHVLMVQLSRTRTVTSAFLVGQNRINLTAMSPGRPGSIFVSIATPRRVRPQ